MDSDSTDEENMRLQPLSDTRKYYFSVIEELSRLGYHRARVFALPDFHRILGGLSWVLVHLDKGAVLGLTHDETAPATAYLQIADTLRTVVKNAGFTQDFSKHDLANMDFSRVEPIVKWACKELRTQDWDEKYFHCFSIFFKTIHHSLQEALQDFMVRLLRPNQNIYYEAPHWDMFDWSILHRQDVPALTVLAEYAHYAQTGSRIYPANAAETATELLKIQTKERQNAAIERLTEMVPVFFDETSPSQQRMAEFVRRTFFKVRVAIRLHYNKRRFADEATKYYEIASQNRVLEKNVKSALEHSITFDLDAMEALYKELEQTTLRTKQFFIMIAKELEDASNLEKDARSNMKNGVMLRYNVHRRELADAYGQKTAELLKITQRAYAMAGRLHNLCKKCKGTRERQAELKKKQTRDALYHYDCMQAIDKGISRQLQEQALDVERLLVQMKAIPADKNDDAIQYRRAYSAYLHDANLLLDDLFMKAKIGENNRAEGIQRNNKLKAMMRKLQESAIFCSEEYEKMLKMTRAIQEVTYELDELESIAEEFKKKVKL